MCWEACPQEAEMVCGRIPVNEELGKEIRLLHGVVYKSRNAYRCSRMFRMLARLEKLCARLCKNGTRDAAVAVQRVSEDLYVFTTSLIPEGHVIGYALIALGISSRVHRIASEMIGKAMPTAVALEDGIDAIFAGIC